MAGVAKPKTRRRKGKPAPVPAIQSKDRRLALWMIALGIVSVFIAAIELYAPAMHGSFIFDDLALPINKYVAHAPLSVWLRGVRPMLMLTYWANYTLSARSPDAYHFTNILIHAINTCLVFLVLWRLLKWSGWSEKESRLAALIGALLFLVHPLQTESVSYIAGRSESLAALFMLAAYTVFVYRRSQGVSWLEAVAVIVFFGLAVASKENAVALAGWLVLTDLFWPGDGWLRQLRRNWRLYGLMAPLGAAALVSVARVLAKSTSAGFSVKGMPWLDYALTQPRALFGYLRLFLLPVGLSIDHGFAVSHSLLEHGAILWMLGVAAIIAAAFVWRKRFPLAAFGVLMWLVLLAPTSSIVPLLDVFVERRMYLALVGLILVGCDLVHRWKPRAAIAAGLVSAYLLCNGWLTYRRNQIWGEPPRVWMQAIDHAPAKFRPYVNLASAAIADRNCETSVPYLERGVSVFPNSPRMIESYSRILECVGKKTEALEQMQRAATIDPHSWVYEWIGLLYGEMGRSEEAGTALHRAVELDPRSVSAHDALALWYESIQENSKALAEYRTSMNLYPFDYVAQRAIVRLESNGVR